MMISKQKPHLRLGTLLGQQCWECSGTVWCWEKRDLMPWLGYGDTPEEAYQSFKMGEQYGMNATTIPMALQRRILAH